jgi:hypothetical protein
MKAKWMAAGMAFFIVFMIVVAGFGQAVHYLWNWLMPEIFGLHAISYWQALGLLGLCWILFGGARWFGRPHRYGGGHRMMERWAKMTPEEREKFQAGLRGWRGRHCDDRPAQEPNS